jgi:hypothetical protein
MQLSSCGKRLPTRHPENWANHSATSAPGTLLFIFLVQNKERLRNSNPDLINLE